MLAKKICNRIYEMKLLQVTFSSECNSCSFVSDG